MKNESSLTDRYDFGVNVIGGQREITENGIKWTSERKTKWKEFVGKIKDFGY